MNIQEQIYADTLQFSLPTALSEKALTITSRTYVLSRLIW